MTLFEVARRVRYSPAMAWGLAILAFTLALVARFASDHMLPAGFPYLTFFPAVILTTFFAGVLPGTVCAIFCGLAAWYWFIPPFGGFSLSASVAIALAFYAGVVGVDILLIQVMHRSLDKLKAEREQTQALLIQQKALFEDQKVRERQQRVLQRELSHRMKNTLAMVQAVVSQSLRNVTDPKVAAELASARIQALARAQDALTATNWSAADVETIVRTSVAPHEDGGDRFRINGAPVELEAQRALGLALAIHELATNATKYGALSNENGVINIAWDVSKNGRFQFRWIETGGPEVVVPAHLGFGSRLTQRVVPSYFHGKASIDFAATGLSYRLQGSIGSVPPHA